jgi:hypothetical protein
MAKACKNALKLYAYFMRVQLLPYITVALLRGSTFISTGTPNQTLCTITAGGMRSAVAGTRHTQSAAEAGLLLLLRERRKRRRRRRSTRWGMDTLDPSERTRPGETTAATSFSSFRPQHNDTGYRFISAKIPCRTPLRALMHRLIDNNKLVLFLRSQRWDERGKNGLFAGCVCSRF